ncbi:MAG: hypothetical protein IID45_06700 [Planctomycetes bacterium]|nr:hypothetical protein [Planctomycetota bacterium]
MHDVCSRFTLLPLINHRKRSSELRDCRIDNEMASDISIEEVVTSLARQEAEATIRRSP